MQLFLALPILKRTDSPKYPISTCRGKLALEEVTSLMLNKLMAKYFVCFGVFKR